MHARCRAANVVDNVQQLGPLDLDDAGQAEVAHLDIVPGIEHHVARLDVSVQHVVAMEVGDALRNLVVLQAAVSTGRFHISTFVSMGVTVLYGTFDQLVK